MSDKKVKRVKKNIHNLPVIKETSLHRIVERVRKKDNTLLIDPITSKNVKTYDYLGVNVNNKGKVTKIFAKQPFYWECWDFDHDIERNNKTKPITKIKNDIKMMYKDVIPDDKELNKGNPFVQYDFEIDFSKEKNWNNSIEFGSIQNYFKGFSHHGKVYFLKKIHFYHVNFSGAVSLCLVSFSDAADFSFAVFSDAADFSFSTFSD